MTSLGIGALAKRVGVHIDTVRYYERSGLLAPKNRLNSGYHRYGEAELTRLRFIRRAQVLGFSLKEMGELLALSKTRDIARDKRATHVKLADVEERIAPWSGCGTLCPLWPAGAPGIVSPPTARS